jgi:1-acyl-sn-glycerol-3-phosphate acyltransferase
MTLILPRAYHEDPGAYDGLSLDRRDPEYIREFLPLLELAYRYYFRVEARGYDQALPDGPFLLIGNHNGGINAPDTAMAAHAWFMTQGVERPIYGLIHPGVFQIPYLNVHAMKLGGIAATARMAWRAIEAGAALLIYPGAGDDAYKPYARRHEIVFGGNENFVRLALRFGIPIVPLVSIGAHETLIVLDDGRARAAELGLDKLGIERMPATIGFPQGLTVGISFNVPFPARIELRLLKPIELRGFPAKASRDAFVVRHVYDHVVSQMQRALDSMAARRNSPLNMDATERA